MTTTATAPPGVRTIARVDVTEVRDNAGGLVDRKIIVEQDCGHTHFLSIPLSAPVPQVGDVSDYHCLPCRVGGDR